MLGSERGEPERRLEETYKTFKRVVGRSAVAKIYIFYTPARLARPNLRSLLTGVDPFK